uniref:Uncharacterized protein n=1 Tax=Nelumbo nucifera TaxID=4432 RepID=A0A822ZN71_NELNU|nr:TPA_asm: hypothetical protein HUJ06_016609 [Nelumbo nucifera]
MPLPIQMERNPFRWSSLSKFPLDFLYKNIKKTREENLQKIP